MSRAAGHRLGTGAGAAGTALVFTGMMIANGATDALDPTSPAATIAATFHADRDDIRLGVTLTVGGVFLCLWFLGWLRGQIGGWLGSVVLCGGVLGLTGLGLHLAVLIAATNESILATPDTARTLLVLDWELGGLLAPGFGALVGATSLALLRHGVVGRGSRPLAWLGVPLALALAGSGFLGGALVVLALLWLFAAATAAALSRLDQERSTLTSSLRSSAAA